MALSYFLVFTSYMYLVIPLLSSSEWLPCKHISFTFWMNFNILFTCTVLVFHFRFHHGKYQNGNCEAWPKYMYLNDISCSGVKIFHFFINWRGECKAMLSDELLHVVLNVIQKYDPQILRWFLLHCIETEIKYNYAKHSTFSSSILRWLLYMYMLKSQQRYFFLT